MPVFLSTQQVLVFPTSFNQWRYRPIYCSSSEWSSFKSFRNLLPSTSAFCLTPIASPIVGSKLGVTSEGDIFDFCLSVSYTADVLYANLVFVSSSSRFRILSVSISNSKSILCHTPELDHVFINCI